ncbi:hypothetical protein, partial [Methanosarcina mazei]|uniref:hypothetical protein n=1 Tax=Methanosarcina mazei TaxID=2209 RepID=UPI001F1C9B7B
MFLNSNLTVSPPEMVAREISFASTFLGGSGDTPPPPPPLLLPLLPPLLLLLSSGVREGLGSGVGVGVGVGVGAVSYTHLRAHETRG